MLSQPETDEDQVDAEEDAERVETRGGPFGHDHQAEQEAQDAGEHHPAPRRACFIWVARKMRTNPPTISAMPSIR